MLIPIFLILFIWFISYWISFHSSFTIYLMDCWSISLITRELILVNQNQWTMPSWTLIILRFLSFDPTTSQNCYDSWPLSLIWLRLCRIVYSVLIYNKCLKWYLSKAKFLQKLLTAHFIISNIITKLEMNWQLKIIIMMNYY